MAGPTARLPNQLVTTLIQMAAEMEDVEPIGHLATALLFALPAWILWDGRTGATFVGFVLASATTPDIDIVLMRRGFPIEHHTVTHTLAFVLVLAAVGGLVAVVLLKPTLQRWWRHTEDETVQRGTIALFASAGLVLGGVSHLFGDMLAGDGYEPIEPLWPLVQEPIEFPLAHYTSPWLNGFLLVAALALHGAVIASGTFPVEHRYRHWRRQLTDDEPADAAD